MTPDPVDLVHRALQQRNLLDVHRGDVMDALNILRHNGLEIVRFAVGYTDPQDPSAECGGCGRRPPMPIVVERWPGDDSHLHPSVRP